MTSQGTASGRFQRACERREVFQAEIAARELGWLSLRYALDALDLVLLYAETDSPKFEPAAVRGCRATRSKGATLLTDVQLAAAALASLRGLRRDRAEKTLLGLL